MSISIRAMKDARMGAAITGKVAAREWLRRLAAAPFAFHLDDDIVGIYGSPSAEKYLSKKRDEVLAVLGEKDAWRTYWAALVKAKKVPKGPVRRNPEEKLFVRLGRERAEREQADALRDALFKARGGLARVREDAGVSFGSTGEFYEFFLRHRGATDADTRAIYKRLSWVPLKGSEALLSAEGKKTSTAAKVANKRMSRATSTMHKKVDFLYDNLRDERTGKRLYSRPMVAGLVANVTIPGHTTGLPMPTAKHRAFLAGLTRMANKWVKRKVRKNPSRKSSLSASETRYLLALREWATGRRLHQPAKPPNMTWERASQFVDLAETMRSARSNPSLPPELLRHHAQWVVIGPRGGVISWHETQAEAKRSAKRGDRVVAASSMRLPKRNPRCRGDDISPYNTKPSPGYNWAILRWDGKFVDEQRARTAQEALNKNREAHDAMPNAVLRGSQAVRLNPRRMDPALKAALADVARLRRR